MENSVKIIAEIGCTHIGDLKRAKNLTKLAAEAGSNIVKFQKRNPIESVPKRLHNKPHPNEMFSYGKTYLEHRINLELNKEEHQELKIYCDGLGVTYATSVWDVTSAKEISKIQPQLVKIPSACNTNFNLLDFVFDKFETVHISLGMTTIEERQNLISYIYKNNFHDRSIIYHCTSIYPCPFEKLHLLEIDRLTHIFPNVGFSNHGYGIAADIVAITLGVKYIERHFIDDRSFRHADASASLEPQGLTKLCRDISNIQKSLEYRPDTLDILEQEQKDKLSLDAD